jgi:cysteine desulfurase
VVTQGQEAFPPWNLAMTRPTFTYLDHAASTPVDSRVLEAMMPWFCEHPANASSSHRAGQAAAAAVAQARQQIADMIDAQPESVTFCSGATESCNLAIKGLLRAQLRQGKPVHIISSETEHRAVLDPLARLAREGASVDLVGATPDGIVLPQSVIDRLGPDTSMVSIMLVNNEIGTINDVQTIAEVCQERGILVHCDASQAAGKCELHLPSLKVDLLSFCSHKMHGPKGVGVLIRSPHAQQFPVESLIEGGGQEHGLRSGSLNVHGIVGFGAAAKLVQNERNDDCRRIGALRDRLADIITTLDPSAVIHGLDAPRVPHILSASIPSAPPGGIVDLLNPICCAGAAACSSAANSPSHVLDSMGVDSSTAAATIRLSLGRTSTQQDVDAFGARLATVLASKVCG